jgi:hypothetical protein
MWRQVAAQEVTLAFHTAIHNHSLKSNKRTTSIIKDLFNQIFTCSRTKTEVIVTKGMAPLAKKQVLNGLQEASFQLWPILLINGSWSTFLLDIIILRKGWRWSPYISLGRETTDLVSYYALELFKKFELYDKVTEVSADNTNTNSESAWLEMCSKILFHKICCHKFYCGWRTIWQIFVREEILWMKVNRMTWKFR